jgi:hypothetical protein
MIRGETDMAEFSGAEIETRSDPIGAGLAAAGGMATEGTNSK